MKSSLVQWSYGCGQADELMGQANLVGRRVDRPANTGLGLGFDYVPAFYDAHGLLDSQVLSTTLIANLHYRVHRASCDHSNKEPIGAFIVFRANPDPQPCLTDLRVKR